MKFSQDVQKEAKRINTASLDLSKQTQGKYLSDTNLQAAKEFEELEGRFAEVSDSLNTSISKDTSEIFKLIDNMFEMESDLSQIWR